MYASDTAATNGWQTINVLHPGVYNLLSFKNGIDTSLAATGCRPVHWHKCRLWLGK